MITDDQVQETLRLGEKANAFEAMIRKGTTNAVGEQMWHACGPAGFEYQAKRDAEYYVAAANHFPALWERCKKSEERAVELIAEADRNHRMLLDLGERVRELEAENANLSENYGIANEGAVIAARERDEARAEAAKWKSEYENLCKFATQFEQQRDEKDALLRGAVMAWETYFLPDEGPPGDEDKHGTFHAWLDMVKKLRAALRENPK